MSLTAAYLEMFPHTLVDSSSRAVLSNIITLTITAGRKERGREEGRREKKREKGVGRKRDGGGG